ncbi:MAG TPA: NAD-dependent epimerase/dehydratase family protein [Methylomirabilota bacterium]
MARVLVLGGAGFIGYHLAVRLADEGHALTLVDDLSRGRADAALAALCARPGVRFVEADLTMPGALHVLSRDWDQVYMLAAVVGVRNVERDPARVLRTNTLALQQVLDWLPAAGETLFFSSTSEVYAGSVALGLAGVPTGEDVALTIPDAGAPRTAYALSKILGEAAVIHAGRARGLRWVIGRYHNVYGPRMGADHVIPELALRAIRREDPFRLYGARQRRAFCHVADAVDATLSLASTEAARGRVVNIGNDAEETVIEDLAELVLRRAGYRPAIERVPAPAGSPERRCPDLRRLRALTGLAPKVSLETGLAETFDWYSARYAAPGGGR